MKSMVAGVLAFGIFFFLIGVVLFGSSVGDALKLSGGAAGMYVLAALLD